mmetsp:Transcript_19310/g.54490  ORF Transcript_19310/g.54490 Transcript_19310/m.54490 type:complete len:358 (+) Transcript_19310:792-1865(+)
MTKASRSAKPWALKVTLPSKLSLSSARSAPATAEGSPEPACPMAATISSQAAMVSISRCVGGVWCTSCQALMTSKVLVPVAPCVMLGAHGITPKMCFAISVVLWTKSDVSMQPASTNALGLKSRLAIASGRSKQTSLPGGRQATSTSGEKAWILARASRNISRRRLAGTTSEPTVGIPRSDAMAWPAAHAALKTPSSSTEMKATEPVPASSSSSMALESCRSAGRPMTKVPGGLAALALSRATVGVTSTPPSASTARASCAEAVAFRASRPINSRTPVSCTTARTASRTPAGAWVTERPWNRTACRVPLMRMPPPALLKSLTKTLRPFHWLQSTLQQCAGSSTPTFTCGPLPVDQLT